jgi:hypothetical protein
MIKYKTQKDFAPAPPKDNFGNNNGTTPQKNNNGYNNSPAQQQNNMYDSRVSDNNRQK